MRYRITGTNRSTGVEMGTTVHAENENEAIAIGTRTMVVNGVSMEGPPSDDAGLPILPSREPLFRFHGSEAFRFGIYAGLGLACVAAIFMLLIGILGILKTL